MAYHTPDKSRSSSCLKFILSLVALMSLNAVEVYADGCSGVNLKGTRDYSVGQTPYALATGDFNSDGKPDIAAADYFGNSVRLAFGDGSGAFASFSNFAVGLKPSSVAAGDLNNDGKLDLVTANYDSNNVSVLLNNGTGVFNVTNFSAGVNPEVVTLADFDGNGKLDVAATNPTGNSIVILLNSGAGGLVAPSSISLSPPATPKDLVTADFNNDGKADLATANNSGSVAVLLGTGTGAFGAPTYISVPPGQDLRAIAVGDFSGDGKLDLVVASYNGWYVTVLNGNGSGGFIANSPLAYLTYPTDVELRDINADGKLDIVAVSSFAFSSGATVNIYYGNGTGGSTQSQEALTGSSARAVAFADLNSDTKPDLVTNYSTSFDAGLSVSLNDGTGKFETAEKIDPVVNAPTSIGLPLIADFNLDGRNDLAYGFASQMSGLVVRSGLVNGDLGPATIYPVGLNTYLVSGDFNNDGKPDIAGGDGSNTAIAVSLNDGSGGPNAPVNYAVGGTVAALVTGDFNNDGKLDLVVASRSLHAVRVFTGDGNGGFLLTTSVNLNANPVSMVAGDFNNDGKLDVVTANACDGTGCPARLITLFAGDDMGGFALPLDLNTLDPLPTLNNQSLAAGDFNGDGRLDLTIAKIASPETGPKIALNNGGGSFPAFTSLPTSAPVAVVVVGDINGDSKPDIVAGSSVNNGGNDLQVLLNHGAGAFDPPVRYAGIPSIQGLAIGDINSDGKRDLVFSNNPPNANAASIWKLLNKCALTRGKATTDFDGDGITDLSVFRPSTGAWYIIYSSNSSLHIIPFGASGDIPVPGDYDGDGKTDVAVWRPSNGTWYYIRSSDGAFAYQQFGANGDIPVQGDYDGDGKTNFAVFRPSTGTWYTSINPAINYGAVVWGASTDIPAPADYDGDGRTDFAIFRPSNAFWYLLQTADGYREQQFGGPTDTPVPADYDGDGKDDFAVFRQSAGVWYTSLNPATNYGAISLGQSGDVLVPGYYDGDGRVDAAVFRQGDWYIFQSTTSKVRGVHFGASGDIPVPFAP